jgi:hypothetical protein
LGYVKLPNGKILLLQLSKNMNDKRYSKFNAQNNQYIDSSNIIFSSISESLKSLFDRKPPFDISSGKGYKELSNLYTRNKIGKFLYLKQGYSVYAYKGSSQVIDSPFSSMNEASRVLNIPVSNISNYIDTGFEIKGYYFYSSQY